MLGRLEELFDSTGRRPADIETVAAARGPGSFTGLRVGLSIAGGLAYGRKAGLYLIDSLPILAHRAAGAPAAIALRDAGRGEVFAWRGGESPLRLLVAELASWLPSSGAIVAEPAGKLAEWVPEAAGREVPADKQRPLSAALLERANWTFEFAKPLLYHEIEALYVQPAAAEERMRKAP
jgi:tRNA threonylcarbamoyladenosine biosynthesis protein TsaB